jgi:hypothetical protein
MSRSPGAAVALTCHPATPCSAVRGIEVEVRRDADALALRYRLAGDPALLRIPARREAQHADKLWQHTCFEVFCSHSVTSAYYELNFSPSTEWAIYRFDAYRSGMTAIETPLVPRVSVHLQADGLDLDARVELDALEALRDSPVLRLGLSAVIEEADGCLSYWALAHPAPKPDFHHAGAFAMSLPVHGSGPRRETGPV